MQMKKKECGQGLTEYAVVLSMVAVAAIAAMGFFGGAIKGKVASLAAAVSGDATSMKNAETVSTKSSSDAYNNAKNKKGNTSLGKNDTY